MKAIDYLYLQLYVNGLNPSLRNVDSIAKLNSELRKQKDIAKFLNTAKLKPLNVVWH